MSRFKEACDYVFKHKDSKSVFVRKALISCISALAKYSPEEFAQCLDVLYEEWKKNGKLKVESDKEKIEFYSREHQAERMAKLLLELMEKKQRKEY